MHMSNDLGWVIWLVLQHWVLSGCPGVSEREKQTARVCGNRIGNTTKKIVDKIERGCDEVATRLEQEKVEEDERKFK